MSDKDPDSESGRGKFSRRQFITYSSGPILAFSGIGTATANRGEESGRRVHGSNEDEITKELVVGMKEASDEEAYYRSLSDREKELLREGFEPHHIGEVETQTTKTVSAQGFETTYTKRHKVPVESNAGVEILRYRHRLDWTVDRDANEVVGASVSTDGSGDGFWRYSFDIDPEERTVATDGCNSTKSGLFQYCNTAKFYGYGYDYCTAELNTRISSAISGFPNGESNTSEIIDGECGRDCY